ncbi:endodeoxyribonuclease [Coemansia nantahalensis]|nr:endodeoxyribonuclease [Coemansia nantahalensis]
MTSAPPGSDASLEIDGCHSSDMDCGSHAEKRHWGGPGRRDPLTFKYTVYQLLSLGQVAYQRDVYYRYRDVLRSVQNVRALCSTVAAFLGVPPPQLRIIPCPKGVLFGKVALELDDGSAVTFTGRNTAFFALLQAGFGERFPNVLLATGKGYPDLNTRRFVAKFLGTLDIAVLVDHDPNGAHIFQVYSEGGLDGSQIWGLDVRQALEFTLHDRSLALRLVHHWSQTPVLRRRMARMAYRGKKTELEAVTQYRAMTLEYVASLIADHDQADRR